MDDLDRELAELLGLDEDYFAMFDFSNYVESSVENANNIYNDGNYMAYLPILSGLGVFKMEKRPGAGHNFRAVIDAIHNCYKKNPNGGYLFIQFLFFICSLHFKIECCSERVHYSFAVNRSYCRERCRRPDSAENRSAFHRSARNRYPTDPCSDSELDSDSGLALEFAFAADHRQERYCSPRCSSLRKVSRLAAGYPYPALYSRDPLSGAHYECRFR